MDYIPSDHEQQMMRFFSRRKIALKRIEDLGLSMPYISAKFTFEQLFLEYVVKDFNNNETEYLKEGIKTLIECLKEVQKQKILTKESAYNEVYEKNKDYVNRFLNTADDNNIKEWINKQSTLLIESNVSTKKTTEEVLIREIAEFKIRLGRVNVIVDIKNDTLQFNDKNKMEQLVIYSKEITKNPYPEIFLDGDAFALFEHLYSVFYAKDSKEIYADFSMIYRRMHNDGFILDEVRPTDYIKWIQKYYDISLGTSLKKTDNALKIRFYEKLKILH